MRRALPLVLLFGFLALIAWTQSNITGSTVFTNVAPSGFCANPQIRYVVPGGVTYTCKNGTWSAATSAGLNGVAMASLATGLVKNTTTTGVPSIAVAGTDYPALPSVLAVAGAELACARGGDTTINQLTVTGATNAAPIVLTVSASPITNGYYVGMPVTVAGVNPSAYNGTTYHVTAMDATHVTLDNGGAPGAGYTSGGTVSWTCANATDAITTNLFTYTSVYSIPGNSWVQGTVYDVIGQYAYFSPAAAANIGTVRLAYGGTNLYVSRGGIVGSANRAGLGFTMEWQMVGLPSSLYTTNLIGASAFPSTSAPDVFSNTARHPMSLTTNTDQNVAVIVGFAATGMASGTYTSGGSITGSAGQTCALSSFNGAGGTGATATVALTGTNTIAGGTALTITNTGSGFTAASTTATLGNGTATCSGTATITTVLGGAQGNGIVQLSLAVRKN